MPDSPYAKVLCSLNGAPPTSGGIVSTTGTTVQFSAENSAFYTSQLWEIYDYPPSGGFSCPAGWSTSPSGVYFSTALTPPSFALGAWGKYQIRLTANGGILSGKASTTLVDESTAIEVVDPVFGLHDTAFHESNQFSPYLQWVAAMKLNWRTIATAISAVSGGVPSTRRINTTAPLTGGGDLSADRTLAISPATDSTAGSMSAADKTKLDAATSTPTAGALVLYDGSGRLVADSFLVPSGQASPSISQAQPGGTGSSAGQGLTLQAQQGQNVSGGSNNNGGNLTLAGGAAGTGGTGGTQGVCTLQGGGSTVVVDTNGSRKSPAIRLQFTTNNVKTLATIALATGYDLLVDFTLYARVTSGFHSGQSFTVRYFNKFNNPSGTPADSTGSITGLGSGTGGQIFSCDETSGFLGAAMIQAPTFGANTITFSVGGIAATNIDVTAWFDLLILQN